MKINTELLRETLYQWHSGQWSAFYAAASSGLVSDKGVLSAELRLCALQAVHPDTTPFETHDCAEAKKEARFLRQAAEAVDTYLCGWPIIHPSDNRVYWPLPWAVVPKDAKRSG